MHILYICTHMEFIHNEYFTILYEYYSYIICDPVLQTVYINLCVIFSCAFQNDQMYRKIRECYEILMHNAHKECVYCF